MNVTPIPVDRIDATDLPRETDPDYVALIAESVAERGLDSPIHVSRPDKKGSHKLLAGAHRLAAVKLLGHATIDAVVFQGSDLDAQLLQIDENLVRRELSALDRAVFLRIRKDLYEQKYPETKQGGDRPSKQSDKLVALLPSFTKATARKLGVDHRTIERAVARAQLPVDVRRRIATTALAQKGILLDLLLSLETAEQQREAVRLVLDEGWKLPAAVLQVQGIEPPAQTNVRDRFNAFLKLWDAMREDERARVREHVALRKGKRS